METIGKDFVVSEQVIENLRTLLNKMIADRGEEKLLQPDIIKFSQLLDHFIYAYTANKIKENQ